MNEDIKLDKASLDVKVSELKKIIDSKMFKESENLYSYMRDLFSDSKGEFVEKFKVEIESEINTVKEIGQLLIRVLDFIMAASEQFAEVDESYNH